MIISILNSEWSNFLKQMHVIYFLVGVKTFEISAYV